ncbi:MAG TPA: ABC transporter substrate-binding protein, partial [Acidimicrobiales bacterium]|nr:ABC transporter substrate-binding protein [Acidimicrobiales bacterium]
RDDEADTGATTATAQSITAAQDEYCAKAGTYGTEDQLAGLAPAANGTTYKVLSERSATNDIAFIGGGRCGSDPLTSGYLLTGDAAARGPDGGGPFVVGFGAYTPNAAPALLNPAVNTQGSMQAASGMLFNGLVGLAANATAVPELAERWDITDGGKSYRFTLRPGVLWSDSTPGAPQPLLAEDVKFSYEAALLIWHARTASSLPSAFASPCTDPGGGGPRRLSCPSIVAKEDDGGRRTVTFSFANPFGPLLQQMPMTDGAIIPSHIFPSCRPGASSPDPKSGLCPTTAQPWPANQPPVGTGPFKVNVAETNPATGLVYDRNPSYWRQGVPYLNKVILAPTNTLAALQSGTIDYLPSIGTIADVNAAKADPQLVVDTGTMAPGGSTNCTQTVMLNLWANSQLPAAIRAGTAAPDEILGDKAPTPMIDPDGPGPEPAQPRGRLVRRAIAMSLEREPGVNAGNPGYVSISGSPGAELASSPTNSGMPVGSTPAPLPAYDKAKAEAFLDAAGFKDANGPAAGGRFDLGLSSFAGIPLANAMKANMEAVGIGVVNNPGQTKIDPDFSQTGPLFGMRNFDILIVSSCQNTDPEMGTRRVYQTDAINGASFTNGSGYTNPLVDGLFNAGRESTDPGVRNQAYKQINDIVATDLPTFWLLQTKSNRAYKASCSGLRPFTGAYPEYASCTR